MAKIIITVEDKPDNKVSIEMTPNFETLMKMDISGHQMTSAHGYAMAMINLARELSKTQEPVVRKIPLIK